MAAVSRAVKGWRLACQRFTAKPTIDVLDLNTYSAAISQILKIFLTCIRQLLCKILDQADVERGVSLSASKYNYPSVDIVLRIVSKPQNCSEDRAGIFRWPVIMVSVLCSSASSPYSYVFDYLPVDGFLVSDFACVQALFSAGFKDWLKKAQTVKLTIEWSIVSAMCAQTPE